MKYQCSRSIGIILLLLWVENVNAGCKGSLKFQTVPVIGQFDENWTVLGSSTRSPFRFYSNRSSPDMLHCANLCYDDVTYFCNSAIYEPSLENGNIGICRLSQRVTPCFSTRRQRRQGLRAIDEREQSEISQGRVLLFCFRCIENDDNDGPSRVAPVTPADLELETSTSNRENVDLIKNEDASVSNVNHEEREFNSLPNAPNVFIHNSKMKFIPIRVMTMNTWIAGNNVANGVNKIANHIVRNNPDIIALQEMNVNAMNQVLQLLGPSWKRCQRSNGDADFILTRHTIVDNYQPSNRLWNSGCRIKLNTGPKLINVWGVHLDYREYGPYTVCFNPSKGKSDLKEMLSFNEHKPKGQSDTNGRMNNIVNLMTHAPFAKNMQEMDKVPLIVAGDFNTPSHLDWTDHTRILHCNSSFEWPVSKLLQDSYFKDSYRQVYPPGDSTGFTWTPIHKLNPDNPQAHRPEPQDRIDFIYYRGNFMNVKSSRVYQGNGEMKLYPYHRDNDWPSDHAAVITDFELVLNN